MQKTPLILGLLCLLLSPTGWAQDRLVMKNGDVLTGNISKISKAEIYIDPPYVDEFAVKLIDVATIETRDTFELELSGYRKIDAQFAVDSQGRQILVADGQSRPLALEEVWEGLEPSEYFTRKSRVDFGLTNNAGNTDSNNTLLYADTQVQVGEHRHTVDLTFRREENEGVKTKEQDLLNYQYGWSFNDPWYLGGAFTYERDPIRELEYRYVLGAVVGRDIFDDAVKFMTFHFGAGYSKEEIGMIEEDGPVGLWGFTYNHQLFSSRIDFHHTHSLTQQFYGDDNSIFKSTTGFRTDLIMDIYVDLSLRYDYETEPADGASNDDSTLTVSVGAEF